MKEIKLSNCNFYALVDDEDYERISNRKWYLNRKGYAQRKERINAVTKNVHMHREVNNTPNGKLTDHINRNKLDNRKANLRTVSNSENAFNSGLCSKNTSGIKGVSWVDRDSRWLAFITINQKRIYLGSSKDKDKAIQFRKIGEVKYGVAV